VKTSAGDFGYDKLVVALGWRTNHFDVEGAEQHSLGVESIEDAIRIRDRVIDQLERATAQALAGHTPDAGLLEFVVVGGGSTGVEVAANLRGLLDDLLPSYPALRRGPTSVHLLQAAGAVLPHMDSRLRRVAAARLDAEAIAVQTNAVAAAIDPDGVRLSDGSRIDARTVVWAAGVKAAPALGLPVDDKGRVKVDDCLRVEGRHGMYALGDIAAVTSDGHPVPPTAQAAVQEADCVAANLVRELRHEAPEPFRFRYMGQLVDLGSRFAVSQLMGRKFSGGFAQLLWRAVYLYKLGGRGERARVVSDWLLDAVSGPRVTRLPLA
jgi:NADH dehydrogenase